MDALQMPPALLECLDAIYRLEREAPPALLAPLARRLGLDRAATGERVLALEAQGLARRDRSGRIVLTAEAERIALGLLRKHRLLECPHGNPIPAADGALAAEGGTPLHRLKPGHAGVILRVEREEPELLKYLAALGLLPHTRVEVEEIAPFGGPILVRVGSSRYALGRKVASHILVREA